MAAVNPNPHFPFLPSKTLLKPFFPIPFPPKTLRRKLSISAAAAAPAPEKQPLPQSAIQRIAEKLRSLGYVEENPEKPTFQNPQQLPISNPGEIFIPLRAHLPKHRVGHTLDPSWSTPENPVPEPGSGRTIKRFHELRNVVIEEEEKERVRKRREGGKRVVVPSLAELTLPREELRRLRGVGIGIGKKLKVGKAGITEGIVNGIHERWRRNEMVKIGCEDICRLNMKRTHELLEKKTGGLVVWRSGSNIILYRGVNYKYPYFLTDDKPAAVDGYSSEESSDLDTNERKLSKTSMDSPVIANAVESHPAIMQGVGLANRVRFQLPGEAQMAEEANMLLEGLGPRFTDWWGYDPLPVDADLLPAVVPGYIRPFRLLPYGVKPKLTNDEMTTLRRLARPLPVHFALGRNRKHQGLAAAIIKLWEKCEIAKIAVKRGVQNTNSELMAEEIKWLTGGTLLARDREFIVFYRGKDFLPTAVSSAIEERRKQGLNVLKNRTDNISTPNAKENKHGTKEHDTEVEDEKENDDKLQGHSEERKLRFSEAIMDRTQTKLSMALAKKAKAEKLLEDLDKEEISKPPAEDKEGITEEERFVLRKVGLRMKPFLLLGRRGVFDGTVENMHLHWKYRELVKVCIGKRSIEEIHGVARTLEAESGGILVAVEPVSRGYAIIVYRGKNYKRPSSLRPRSLLSKREAMKRSLEEQRRQSLKLHVLKLSKNIDSLKIKLEKDKDTNSKQLTADLNLGFVEQDINENHYNDAKIFLEDSANEESRERHVTDATAEDTDDLNHNISQDSVNITHQDLQGDVSSTVKRGYLFERTEPAHQPRSELTQTKGFLYINERSENVEPSDSDYLRKNPEKGNPVNSQDQTSSSTTTYTKPYTRGRDSNVVYPKAELEPKAQKGMNEVSSLMPFRASQLSNKERLLLRKQALRIKKQPVIAVGKSNIVTGVAKTIKEHFKKHPLAIVNIKGRAKGTSIQEVVYNLQQATGAALVSQEPSKVILYRGWGPGSEPDQSSGKVDKILQNDSINKEVKARPIISPELIAAMRLELDGLNEKLS